MDEAIRNAVVFGALALVAGGCAWWPRWGWLASSVVAGAAVVCAVVLGVFDPTAPAVWISAWPGEPLLLLLGWGLLNLGIYRLGGPGVGGASVPSAFVGGAAWGALPLALAQARGQHPRQAARLVLAAVAGGLCGPLGSAPLLLLGDRGVLALLWPLGLALAALAALPLRGVPQGSARGGFASWLLLGASLPVWLLAVLVAPQVALLVGLVLVWGLVVWRRPAVAWPAWRPGVSLVAVLLCVLMLVPAGVLDFLAAGLDDARVMVGSLLDAGFGLAGLALGAALGGVPIGLAGALTACSDPVSLSPGLRAALIAGAAVGALIPVLSWVGSGALRAGWGRWAGAALLLMAWLALRAL